MFCTNCGASFEGNFCPKCGANYSGSAHQSRTYRDNDGDIIDLSVVCGVYKNKKALRLFFKRCTSYSDQQIGEIIQYATNNITPNTYGIIEASRLQRQIENGLPVMQKIATPLQRVASGVIAVVGIIALFFSLNYLMFGGYSSTNKSYVTQEQFDSVETGMSYYEVVNVMGSEGELLSQVDLGEFEYKTEMYSWIGKSVGSNCNITFQGDKVVSKAQIGLT